MKREDLVVGRIYFIAGSGPMQLKRIDQSSDCECSLLFKTPLGGNHYVMPFEVSREADPTVLRNYAQNLQNTLGAQNAPAAILAWADKLEKKTSPVKTKKFLIYCPECNSPLQYQSARLEFRHRQPAEAFINQTGQIDMFHWQVNAPGVVTTTEVMCPACGYWTELKQGKLIANCDVLI